MMSVRLGIYDLFANIIPGFLYIFVFEEIGKLFGLSLFDLIKGENSAVSIITIVVIAFIAGHIFNSLSFQFWYKIFIRKHDSKIALEGLKQQYPKAQFNFTYDDDVLIQSILYREDDKLLEKIESLHVSALFLRNISLGFFMLFVVELITYLGFFEQSAISLGGISLVFSFLALRQSKAFYRWFYRNIFFGGLNHSEIVGMTIKGRTSRGKK